MTQFQRIVITPDQRLQDQLTLTPDQRHYLIRVLRLGTGDRFIAIDGQGHWWLAELLQQRQARILEAIVAHTELPVAVTLLVAMPKGNGMDEIVRQTIELGVSCVVPIVSERTLLQPSAQKQERWQRIAQEAAEQAERQTVPEVLHPQAWAEAMQTWNVATALCYLCDARGDRPHLLPLLQAALTPAIAADDRPPLVIATGAEGGWTAREVDMAEAAGFQPVSLGKRILRAVTAPVAAMALVSAAIEASAT
jgi:16S rRNA (uracil1498-N3)-methyltransferase